MSFQPNSQAGESIPQLPLKQPGTLAPDEFLFRVITTGGINDPKWLIGYNASNGVASEPRFVMAVEGDYWDGAHHVNEWYVEQYWPGGDKDLAGNLIAGGTTTTGSQTLPLATINVADTSGFPASGFFIVGGGFAGENGDLVTYTGKTGTSFTGCSGGSGVKANGTPVSHQYNRPVYVISRRDTSADYGNKIDFDVGVMGSPDSLFNVHANTQSLFFVHSTVMAIGSIPVTMNGVNLELLKRDDAGPRSLGYMAWNFDPLMCNGGAGMGAAGTQQIIQIPWPVARTITTITMNFSAGGGTLTANQCLAGILDASGTVLATTVNQATAWAGTGVIDMALTSPTPIPAGTYPNPCIYVSFYWNGSSQPSMLKGNTGPPQANGNVIAAQKRFATTSATGRTTTLANVTMGSNADGTASAWWCAVK